MAEVFIFLLTTHRADIALVGLAVMGQNLILNMNDHGFKVCAFNRTVEKVDNFLKNEAKGTNIIGAHSLEEMVSLLKKPRRIMLMVQAGKAVDAFIDQLVTLSQSYIRTQRILDLSIGIYPNTIFTQKLGLFDRLLVINQFISIF